MNSNSRPLSLAYKLQQESVKEHIEQAKHLSNAGPYTIELDPTTACNLACHDCISANLLNQGGIDNSRLLKLAEEFAQNGIKAVVLIGGGEPMAHPKFGELVTALHSHDIHIGVTTNGTMIKRYLKECAEMTKWLRVSVDAGSDEVFADYRPHASGKSLFKPVIESMKQLAHIKTGLLGYSFLILTKYNADKSILNTNATDIYKAAKIAKDIGCDYFEVKPAFDMMHYLQKQDIRVVDAVNSNLEKARSLADENFRVIAPFTLDEALNGIAKQTKDYQHCLISNHRSLITPSGAYVCPYHRGNPEMLIGDITRQSFTEIWQGKQRAQIMQKLDPSKDCQFHCIRHESNLVLEKLYTGETIETVNDFDRFI